MPDDSRIPCLDVEEMAMRSPVVATVKNGRPKSTIARTTFEFAVTIRNPIKSIQGPDYPPDDIESQEKGDAGGA